MEQKYFKCSLSPPHPNTRAHTLTLKTIGNPAQIKSSVKFSFDDWYKDGLPLLGEIYEMEDRKPRLLIKIIHFCQSWPGENLQQYQ